MKEKRKNFLIILVLLVILIITFMYSSYITSIKIDESQKSKAKKLNIYFDNAKISEKSMKVPIGVNIEKKSTNLSFKINLQNISDYYEFDVDVINKDKLDGMILSYYLGGLSDEQSKLIDYIVTYKDGIGLKENDLLKSNKKDSFKIVVKYKNDIDINSLSTINSNLNLSFSIQYIKADDSAKIVNHKKLKVSVGDYISMYPSYDDISINTTQTGYTGTNQMDLKPKELNLWRVLKTNDDGTFDVVSEHASSIPIYFEGQTGYLNYIGYLNTLAKTYENKEYTTASRAFGYNKQTEYLSNTSSLVNPAPWNNSTVDNENEKLGGGDTLYTTDINLITTAMGTIGATDISGKAVDYWVASRYYFYRSQAQYYWSCRNINSSFKEDFSDLYYFGNKKFNSRSVGYSIRPILTLKANITGFSGSGKAVDPYILN